MNAKQADKLASKIARAIFKEGDGPTKCQRIQFKGGTYPYNELDQRGLCESALKGLIERFLRRQRTTI